MNKVLANISFSTRAGPPPQQHGPINTYNMHGPVLPNLPRQLSLKPECPEKLG